MNLTCIVKDYVLKVQNKFENTVTKLEWIATQRQVDAALRNLEFGVAQFEAQLQELLRAFEAIQQGNFPLSLISFEQLHAILRNVTLTLLPGFELPLGSHQSQIPWYCSHIEATMMADYHNFALLLKLPLTTAGRKFDVFRIHSFPRRVTNGTYVRIQLNNDFLAVSDLHHSYLALTENELNQCESRENTKVCTTSKPIRSGKNGHSACEFNLYHGDDLLNSDCNRLFTVRPPEPEMQRYGDTVLYYMPESTLVNLRCHGKTGWATSSLILEGAGMLTNSGKCHISMNSLQLYAHLNGEAKVSTQLPAMDIHSHQAIVSHDELNALKNMAAEQTTYKLLSTLTSYQEKPSVENLLELHSAMTTHTNCPGWTTSIIISATVSICILMMYHCTLLLWHKLNARIALCKHPKMDGNTASAAEAPVPIQRTSQATNPAPAPTTSSVDPIQQHSVYAIRETPLH